MTRKPTSRLTTLITLSIAALTPLLNSAALAQTIRANQTSNKPSATLRPQLSGMVQGPPISFARVVTYDSGGQGANAAAVADLNGDGHLDLVVANASGIGVLLGNGNGTFQTATSYSLNGNTANSVAIADLNGDGHPDIAIASRYSHSVFVLLGKGDGTFKAPIAYETGGVLGTSVAIADLNGDGHPDLVVTDVCQYLSDCWRGIVSVLLGKGNGTFMPATSYAAGGYYASSVAIADVNGDGHLDLVVASQCYNTGCSPFLSGPVSVMLGNGDGTFQDAVGYGSGGEYPVSVAIADVNGDGHPDLAVVNQNDQVGVLLGNGDGSFSRP